MKGIEKFPQLMPQVRRVRVVSKLQQNCQVSEWEVEVEGTVFRWRQEDVYDDQQLSWSFCMLAGDCGTFKGQCLVRTTDSDSASKLTVDISFDWGIPQLGRHVGQVLEEKARRNLTRMIAVLRKEASRSILLTNG